MAQDYEYGGTGGQYDAILEPIDLTIASSSYQYMMRAFPH